MITAIVNDTDYCKAADVLYSCPYSDTILLYDYMFIGEWVYSTMHHVYPELNIMVTCHRSLSDPLLYDQPNPNW